MPAIENVLPDISPKSMTRRLNRSSVVWSLGKAKFMGVAIPKLDRTIRQLHDSLCELAQPITVIVGQGDKAQAVQLKDYNAQAKITNALIAAIDTQRALLGFPGPGRRRNEDETERSAKAQPSVIELV